MEDAAITEFLMEHAQADRKPRAFRRACSDQSAVDGGRPAIGRRAGPLRPVALRALPARRLVEAARKQILRRVEAARSITPQALIFGDLDICDRQLVDEARRQRGLPGPARTAVLGEGDLGALPRPRKPDMGEPPLLFEA